MWPKEGGQICHKEKFFEIDLGGINFSSFWGDEIFFHDISMTFYVRNFQGGGKQENVLKIPNGGMENHHKDNPSKGGG